MGHIVACGGGFDTSESIWKLHRFLKKLTGKEHPSFLLIPTSAFDEVNRGTLNAFYKLGCSVDTLCLTKPYTTEKMIKDKIEASNIISVPGGNAEFLINTWRQTGADKLIKKAYDDGKVLTGSSAGAMCWFREGLDNSGEDDGLEIVELLDLKPYCYCPHYEVEIWQSFDEFARTRNISSVACENGAALCLSPEGNCIVNDERDAKCWYFDAEDNYKKYDLSEHPEILAKL